MKNIMKQTGIYLAYPKSKKMQSIYKIKNYKTKVNKHYTKVGITQTSFASRKKNYEENFGNIKFTPLAIVNKKHLNAIEKIILTEIEKEFPKAGKSHEWFHTTNRKRLIKIVNMVLEQHLTNYVWLTRCAFVKKRKKVVH